MKYILSILIALTLISCATGKNEWRRTVGQTGNAKFCETKFTMDFNVKNRGTFFVKEGNIINIDFSKFNINGIEFAKRIEMWTIIMNPDCIITDAIESKFVRKGGNFLDMNLSLPYQADHHIYYFWKLEY